MVAQVLRGRGEVRHQDREAPGDQAGQQRAADREEAPVAGAGDEVDGDGEQEILRRHDQHPQHLVRDARPEEQVLDDPRVPQHGEQELGGDEGDPDRDRAVATGEASSGVSVAAVMGRLCAIVAEEVGCDRDASMTDVLVVGESLVDIVQRADGTSVEYAGGSAANVAVALARLGRPVEFVTAYADDAPRRGAGATPQPVGGRRRRRPARPGAHRDRPGDARRRRERVVHLRHRLASQPGARGVTGGRAHLLAGGRDVARGRRRTTAAGAAAADRDGQLRHQRPAGRDRHRTGRGARRRGAWWLWPTW